MCIIGTAGLIFQIVMIVLKWFAISFQVSDQKLIKSWSLRHDITITSPVVWQKHEERFLCVANNKVNKTSLLLLS